jgi:putative spermidine/putrescine transport system permease protein
MTATGYGSAAVPELVPAAPVDQHPTRRRRRRASGTISRRTILFIAAIYFIGPLIAAISFTVQSPHGGVTFDAYRQIFAKPATGQIGFTTALLYSLEIAVVTIIITLALMLPTQLLLHLRLPKWRGTVEIITLLPLVFPPVVLVVGVSDVYKWVQPSGSAKGGSLFSVLRYIRETTHPLLLVPSLRTAIINAGFLCFALVMGEYTISSILLYTKPFPVWLAQLPTTSGQVQAAVSVFSLLLVEILLLLIGALNWRRATEKKG